MTARLSLLLALALLGACGQTKPVPARPKAPRCNPSCMKKGTCDKLDDALVAARRPMLACVGKQAHKGRLHRAHRCYRALRLLESARWWLRTLTAGDALNPRMYSEPVATVREQFICHIERLANAKTAAQIERLYLDMVRSYP